MAGPGTVIDYAVPDRYDRPWAHIRDEHWEQGMKRPAADDVFTFEW
jgi:hypothetical protein